MSGPKAFSVASTTAAVPGGPMIGRSPRSAMWSLCRWVSSRADKAVGAQTDRRCALQHAASAIHQENLSAGPHQGGRPGPIRVGDRTAGTEQRDFDHGFRHVTDPGRLPVN
jgi:hypothetical protein